MKCKLISPTDHHRVIFKTPLKHTCCGSITGQFFELLVSKFSTMSTTTMSMAVTDLRPSDTHSKAYSPRKVDMLVASMLQQGQLEPIVINKQNVILSGVLRWQAAK